MDETQSNDKRSSRDLHPVQSYFIFDPITNASTCKVATCNHIIPGRHSNNLSKHIERNHNKLFDELSSEISGYIQERKKYRLSHTTADFITVRIKKVHFENGLLGLVNINGRPFSLFHDSGMCKILDPILNAFKESGNPISIHRESLQRASAQNSSNLMKNNKRRNGRNNVFNLHRFSNID